MLVILYQSGCKSIARKVASDLEKAFADNIKVGLIAATSSSLWPAAVDWDDLLIVMYNSKEFPPAGNAFIERYLQERSKSAVLPVAVDASVRKPPDAAAAFKALEYDDAAKGSSGRLVNRVGGMLGLRVQARACKIFISYRAIDGTAIATQLHDHLASLGHEVFLDEVKEIDGETKILPGSAVQSQIDEALEKSNFVLLIDTPSAPGSKWIMHEVDTAEIFAATNSSCLLS